MARPLTYDPNFHPKNAYKLTLLFGATDRQLAFTFEVDTMTILRWKEDHPEFKDALLKGKAIADAKVAHGLYKRATGFSHEAVKIFLNPKTGEVIKETYQEYFPPETRAAVTWLSNRQPEYWRQKIQIELTNPKEKLAEILGCSVAELPFMEDKLNNDDNQEDQDQETN